MKFTQQIHVILSLKNKVVIIYTVFMVNAKRFVEHNLHASLACTAKLPHSFYMIF